MDKNKLRAFNKHLSQQPDRDYLFSLLAFGSSANLVGLKPASLLHLPQGQRPLVEVWDLYKTEISRCFNLEYRELRRSSKGILVLLFNRTLLEDCLSDPEKQDFLEIRGFKPVLGLDFCLQELTRRFSELCPDEVGIFLGYSLGDVRGFIENRGRGGLFCRYWRVYEKAAEAHDQFKKIDHARNWVMEVLLQSQKPDYSRLGLFYPSESEKTPGGSVLLW